MLKRALLATAATAVAALVAVLPAAASADTGWTKISSDLASGITVPEIGILGTTAVVTWEQDTSPSTADIVSDTFQTSPANDVANGVPAHRGGGLGDARPHAGARPDTRPAGSRSRSQAPTRRTAATR